MFLCPCHPVTPKPPFILLYSSHVDTCKPNNTRGKKNEVMLLLLILLLILTLQWRKVRKHWSLYIFSFCIQVNYLVIKKNLEINHSGIVKYNHFFFSAMTCPPQNIFHCFQISVSTPWFPILLFPTLKMKKEHSKARKNTSSLISHHVAGQKATQMIRAVV